MAQQGDVEGRMSRCLGRKRRGGCARHLPPCLCCARHGGGFDPHDERQHARSRRRHRQPPRGREVEQWRLSPGLDHNSADLTAFDDIGAGPQCGQRIGRFDQDQPGRIEPEFRKAGGVKMTAVAAAALFAHPEHGPAGRAGADGGHQGKARRGAGVLRRGGKHLVQGVLHQPAPDAAVERIDAERHPHILTRAQRRAMLRQGMTKARTE